MELIANILLIVLFICTGIYGYLTYQVWQLKKHDLKRFQKLVILDGWWIFNSKYINDNDKHLIFKGRLIFIITLITGIIFMVIASSSTKI